MRDVDISDTNWSNFASISISKLSHTKQSRALVLEPRALEAAALVLRHPSDPTLSTLMLQCTNSENL